VTESDCLWWRTASEGDPYNPKATASPLKGVSDRMWLTRKSALHCRRKERVDGVEWSDPQDARLGRRSLRKQSYSLIPKRDELQDARWGYQ